MFTITPAVGIAIALPACATVADAPRIDIVRAGVEPPGVKPLSGEVTIRTGGTHVP